MRKNRETHIAYYTFGDRERWDVLVLVVLSVKVEAHLTVQCGEEFLPCLAVVHRSKVKRIAVGDRPADVVVPGTFVGETLFGIELVNADLECPYASGVGVADGAAIPARDAHHGFAGIEFTEYVAVDVRTPKGVPQHGLLIYRPFHSVRGC